MPAKPRLLELYSCQGGAAAGYALAGFDVTCVDLFPQPRNPFRFYQDNAIEYVKKYGHAYDVITGGPPCQRYSKAQRIQNREHPDLIADTREVMRATGKPYVIENVEDAAPELSDPILLCGQSFGLRTYRHRLFESNVIIRQPEHEVHRHPTVKMGRALGPRDYYHAVGNFSGVELVRSDMGVPWMDRDGIRECIPPAYAKFIGLQLIKEL
jgi:DNA (cytosine-5)-methyltransferase 1